MESEDSGEDSEKVNIIQLVQFDGSYESLRAFSQDGDNHNLSNPSNRSKYYKQTYRTAWESMPDFKGWLRGIEGEPTRAYCLYCRKSLHAHRLSLLKHTCTLRHQKAAQIHSARKVKGMAARCSESSNPTKDNECDVSESVVEYTEIDEGDEANEDEQEDDDLHEEEEDEEMIGMEPLSVQFQQHIPTQPQMGTVKPPISTHVLDTSSGDPASGLQVSLYKLIDGRWTYINEGVTNGEGRFHNFMERSDFSVGRYKLHFDVDRYFEGRKVDSFYPFIEIVFDCKTQSGYYHVPLILSPYGYSTYRGT